MSARREEFEGLAGGNAVDKRLARLLLIFASVQVLLVISLILVLIISTGVLNNSIHAIDIDAVSAFLESIRKSGDNVERATTVALGAAQSASRVFNDSILALQSVNTLLEHPRLSVSLSGE